MTVDELVAFIAAAKVKGLAGTAVILFDGALISPNYEVEYGKFAEGSTETVEVAPSFGLKHLA
jgi:hypothetical protein